MHVINSRVIGVYSVFSVRAIDALFRCLRPFTSPYQPHPPVNVHYLHIYGTSDVSQVCKILEFGLCGCVSRLFLHLRDDHTFEVHHSLFMMATVSSPCAALSSPSILKNCRVVLLGLGLGLEVRVSLSI